MGRKSKLPQTKFGKELMRLRKEKNLTQGELAKESGVSEKNISKYESGDTIPREKTLIELEKYFGEDLHRYLEKPKLSVPITDMATKPKSLNDTSSTTPVKTKKIPQVIELREIITLEEANDLLKEVLQSWFQSDGKLLMKYFYQKAFFIKELSIELTFNREFLVINFSSADEKYIFFDILGFPMAFCHLQNSPGFQSIWFNYQLNDFQKLSLVKEHFNKGILHFYDQRLNWLEMKNCISTTT